MLRLLERKLAFIFGLTILVVFTGMTSLTHAQPLEVSIQNKVDDAGNVQLALTLKNSGSQPIHHLHPMFHFHHSMSRMTKLMRLEPGQSITLENDKHPPVMRVGRYPLTAQVEYWTRPEGGMKQTIIATDSFYFKEPLESQVTGRLESMTGSESSIVKVMLQNHSDSLKNLRMMLLLPPELESNDFSGVMGFTLRGGESKVFDIRIFRRENQRQDRFPVHLMIEYGEMLNHYSGEIAGVVRFSPDWYSVEYQIPITILAFISLIFLGYYYRINNKN